MLSLEHLQGQRFHNLSEQPVPVDHSHGLKNKIKKATKQKNPHCYLQLEFSTFQLVSVASHPIVVCFWEESVPIFSESSSQVVVDSNKVSAFSLKFRQTQLSSLVCHVLSLREHGASRWWPSAGLAAVCPGESKAGQKLQVQSLMCWRERKDHCLPGFAHNIAQDVFVLVFARTHCCLMVILLSTRTVDPFQQSCFPDRPDCYCCRRLFHCWCKTWLLLNCMRFLLAFPPACPGPVK